MMMLKGETSSMRRTFLFHADCFFDEADDSGLEEEEEIRRYFWK